MNKRLTAFSILLLLAFAVSCYGPAVKACDPDCEDCYEWDAGANGGEGDCVYACSEGQICCEGGCVDLDDCEVCCGDECYDASECDCCNDSCRDDEDCCYEGILISNGEMCSECSVCQNGTCVDDDDECENCDECVEGQCLVCGGNPNLVCCEGGCVDLDDCEVCCGDECYDGECKCCNDSCCDGECCWGECCEECCGGHCCESGHTCCDNSCCDGVCCNNVCCESDDCQICAGGSTCVDFCPIIDKYCDGAGNCVECLTDAHCKTEDHYGCGCEDNECEDCWAYSTVPENYAQPCPDCSDLMGGCYSTHERIPEEYAVYDHILDPPGPDQLGVCGYHTTETPVRFLTTCVEYQTDVLAVSEIVTSLGLDVSTWVDCGTCVVTRTPVSCYKCILGLIAGEIYDGLPCLWVDECDRCLYNDEDCSYVKPTENVVDWGAVDMCFSHE